MLMIKRLNYILLIYFISLCLLLVCSNYVKGDTDNEASSIVIEKILNITFPVALISAKDGNGKSYLINTSDKGTLHIDILKTDYNIINEDTRRLVIAFQYISDDIFSPKEENFIAQYLITREGIPTILFNKKFKRSNRGEFISIYYQDITGDEIPEIFIKYRYANVGMLSWDWKDVLYIIDSELPYRTIFEHTLREGEGGTKGEDYVKRYEIVFKDIDSDGTKEIFIDTYEGKEEHKLTKVNSSPIQYIFNSKEYKIIEENGAE